MVPVILGVFVLSFLLARVIPANPAIMVIGLQSTPAEIRAEDVALGLNLPLWHQLWNFVVAALHGNFGTSIVTGQPVLTDLSQRLPATAELTVASLVIAVVVSVPLGILSALYRDSWLDWVAHVISLGGVSMPLFWLGLILILVFYSGLHIAPAPMGDLGIIYTSPPPVTHILVLDALIEGNWPILWSALGHLVLPALTLSTGTIAILVRMLRTSMLEVMHQDFVRTALAKGATPWRVYMVHAFRNALVPVVTIFGLQVGYLLGGAVLVETVFNWPGVGSYVTNSILGSDYAPVEVFALLSAIVYSLINLCVDVINAAIDPRITYY
jgi:peptide/nickel transport system permease protein